MRTPRGRVATKKAYHHFGLRPSDSAARGQQSPLDLGFDDGEDAPNRPE